MMLRGFSGMELVIVLVIVILVFGVGRITKIAGELGSGIRAFRKGLRDDTEAEDGETGSESESDKKAGE